MVSFAGGRRSAAESSSSSSTGADGEDLESLAANIESGSLTSGRHIVTDSTCYEIGTAWTHREVLSAGGRGGSGAINSAVAKPQTLTACGMTAHPGRNEQVSGSGSNPHVLFDSDSNEIIVKLNLRTVLAELPPFLIKYEGRPPCIIAWTTQDHLISYHSNLSCIDAAAAPIYCCVRRTDLTSACLLWIGGIPTCRCNLHYSRRCHKRWRWSTYDWSARNPSVASLQ